MKRLDMCKKITDFLRNEGDQTFGASGELIYAGYDGEIFFDDKIGDAILTIIEEHGSPECPHGCESWDEEEKIEK